MNIKRAFWIELSTKFAVEPFSLTYGYDIKLPIMQLPY